MQAFANLKQRLSGLTGRLQQPVLGIDIGSHSIKLVALRVKDGRIEVMAAAHTALPERVVSGHKILDPGRIAVCIRGLLDKAGIKAAHAVVGLPVTEATIKTFSLDLAFTELDEISVEEHLVNEITPYVTYAPEHIRLDYQFLSPVTGAETISVLTVATADETVVNHQTVLAQAGLSAQCLELEHYALARVLPYLNKTAWQDKTNPCIAFLDFGKQYATITVVEGDEVLYTDEQLIRLDGQGTSQFIQQWAARALTLFYTSGLRSEVDGVVLSGGSVLGEPAWPTLLESALGAPVIFGNPFTNMKVAGHIEGEPQAYVLSCGLALRGLQHD